MTFSGSIVSQNDCRLWNKSYKYNNTYSTSEAFQKYVHTHTHTHTHTHKLTLSTYTMYTNL
jgi:hypothetical protein